MITKRLSQMESGEKGRIVRVSGGRDIRRRLLDMGVVSGASVSIKRVAPLGDPVLIRVKDYDLALRRQEADNITVELTVMPLAMALPGDNVRVVSLKAGWGLQRRLKGLGLDTGTMIHVIDAGKPGPVLLDVYGSNISLGHGVARRIMVTSITEEAAT